MSEDAKGVPYDESTTSKLALIPLSLNSDPRVAQLVQRGGGAAAAMNLAGEAAFAQPGCRLVGTLHVRRVPGHLYVAAPRVLTNMDGRLVYTVPQEALTSFNVSHTISRLSFGPPFPGQVSPLEGVSSAPTKAVAAFQYHLRVVPTVYEPLYGRNTVDSQQYSASDFVQEYEPSAGVFVHPGIWLRYDFSPILVRRVESRRTLLQFATSLCAILGGVFALSGLLDQLLYRATEKKLH